MNEIPTTVRGLPAVQQSAGGIPEPRRVPLQTRGMALIPQNLDECYSLAQALYNTAIGKNYGKSWEDVFLIIAAGMELDLAPVMALQRITTIKGRITLWGEAVPGLIMRTGKCEDFREWIDGEGDNMVAYCEIKRAGIASPTKRSFSVDDAKRAGLWQTEPIVEKKKRDGSGTYRAENDSPWYRYPKRMLQMRARGFAARDSFPDALSGLYIFEEIAHDPSIADLSGPDPTPALAPAVQRLAGQTNGERSVVDSRHIERELAQTAETADVGQSARGATSDSMEAAARVAGGKPGKEGPEPRYFIHPESDSFWMTTDGSTGHDGSGDAGLVEEVDEEQYLRFKAEVEEARARAEGSEGRVQTQDPISNGDGLDAYVREGECRDSLKAMESGLKHVSNETLRDRRDGKAKGEHGQREPKVPLKAKDYEAHLELWLGAMKTGAEAVEKWKSEMGVRNKLVDATSEDRDRWKKMVTELRDKLDKAARV